MKEPDEIKKEEGFIKVGDVMVETNDRFQAEVMMECIRTGKPVFKCRSEEKDE